MWPFPSNFWGGGVEVFGLQGFLQPEQELEGVCKQWSVHVLSVPCSVTPGMEHPGKQ